MSRSRFVVHSEASGRAAAVVGGVLSIGSSGGDGGCV